VQLFKKQFPCVSFIPEDYQTKAVFRNIPKAFPIIHGGRGDLKRCDITLQSNESVDFETEISFFFGRAPSIICTLRTERTTIAGTPELADRKGKAIDYEITAGGYGKRLGQFLPKEFRHLQKCPSGAVEACAAAEPGEEVTVITLHKGIPGIFRVYADQFTADTQRNDFGIGQLCGVHIPPLRDRIGDKLLIQIVNNGIDK